MAANQWVFSPPLYKGFHKITAVPLYKGLKPPYSGTAVPGLLQAQCMHLGKLVYSWAAANGLPQQPIYSPVQVNFQLQAVPTISGCTVPYTYMPLARPTISRPKSQNSGKSADDSTPTTPDQNDGSVMVGCLLRHGTPTGISGFLRDTHI